MKRGFTRRELKLLRSAADEQKERMRGTQRWRNLDFLIYVVIVVMVAFAVRTFIAEPIRVDGSSMYPTLIDSELMFVEKVTYWSHAPARGDVLICYYPGYSETCVKRVIGLPGETLEIRDGRVYVDGVLLDESDYYSDETFASAESYTVGEGEIFVMGDNRGGSKDSRNHDVGAIPYRRIVGKVYAVIWPIDNVKTLEAVRYG